MIISVSATHKEYGEFESYIVKNCFEIEKLANLFASDNPNLEELTVIIDRMLSIKKDKMDVANNNLKK